jgi:hypothetical protein
MILATGKDEPKLSRLSRTSSIPWRFLEVTVVLEGDGERILSDLLSAGTSRASHSDPDPTRQTDGPPS